MKAKLLVVCVRHLGLRAELEHTRRELAEARSDGTTSGAEAAVRE